ncbi:MAG: ATP-binding cassette domain-containing protein, partial [Spongiibacteraceae bacterium]|nr:ATP-binding cassette domain-containing protein [Spongiibacteraceae bacterium]
MPAPLVSIHDLYFSYRVDPALHIADWAWQPGEHWAVVGGNGAGKTTLACLISDAIRPGRGTVSWQPGLDPNRDVAYVSFDTQRVLVERDIRFDDSETREEAIDTGTSVRDLILQGAPETPEFTHLLALFGLTAIADRGLRVLSTGESRK